VCTLPPQQGHAISVSQKAEGPFTGVNVCVLVQMFPPRVPGVTRDMIASRRAFIEIEKQAQKAPKKKREKKASLLQRCMRS